MAEHEEVGVELDEMLVRPGTYFNPRTEVVVIVDDSASVDQEIFGSAEYEGVEWVRISDDAPVDGDALDADLERFQTHHHAGTTSGLSAAAALEHDDDAYHDAGEEPDLEPDPELEEEEQ